MKLASVSVLGIKKRVEDKFFDSCCVEFGVLHDIFAVQIEIYIFSGQCPHIMLHQHHGVGRGQRILIFVFFPHRIQEKQLFQYSAIALKQRQRSMLGS